MKLESFIINTDNISIDVKGIYYDLHNNFDFRSIIYDVSKRHVQLLWIKGAGEWVPKDLPESIMLVFDGVSAVKLKERDPQMPYTEDDCLGSIGFSNLSDENFCNHEPFDDAECLFMEFMSGAFIKIQSDSCLCVVK